MKTYNVYMAGMWLHDEFVPMIIIGKDVEAPSFREACVQVSGNYPGGLAFGPDGVTLGGRKLFQSEKYCEQFTRGLIELRWSIEKAAGRPLSGTVKC